MSRAGLVEGPSKARRRLGEHARRRARQSSSESLAGITIVALTDLGLGGRALPEAASVDSRVSVSTNLTKACADSKRQSARVRSNPSAFASFCFGPASLGATTASCAESKGAGLFHLMERKPSFRRSCERASR